MLFDQDTIKQIQAIAFDAYKTTGRVAALLDGGGDGNRSLAQEMSAAAFRLERGTVAFRRLCEQCQTLPPETAKDAPPPAPLDLACWVERSDYGWLHIRLNTLLPHCRYDAPIWLSDTVARALDRYEAAHARLPMLEHALLIIDEHCEIDARRVYDQDNKGWKAIANAIKGRLIPDDDQYSLGVCLLSRRLPQNVCHIYLIPEQDAGDFLTLRAENYLPFSLTSGYNYGSIPKYTFGYVPPANPHIIGYIPHTEQRATIGYIRSWNVTDGGVCFPLWRLPLAAPAMSRHIWNVNVLRRLPLH